MSDEEAASLCEIAYSALLTLPRGSPSRFAVTFALPRLRDEIARLRNRTPEDVQNEFERA